MPKFLTQKNNEFAAALLTNCKTSLHQSQPEQLQGKCYQEVQLLRQQAAIFSFYQPATCFGRRL